jgi:hypothetical protein
MNVVTAVTSAKGQNTMKTFTIESETNNITAHTTAREAESVSGAEHFATAAALAGLAAHWPAARLVEIWNSLPGATAVRKFKDRETAVTRIWNAIESLGEPAAVAVKTAGKPHAASVRAGADKKATRTRKTPKSAPRAKGARQGSKTEKILDLLKRPGGASLNQIMKATEWQAHSVRGFISGTLGRKMGLKVVSVKTEDGARTYSVKV